jgi:glycolate oxidase iron-sulfur subunit
MCDDPVYAEKASRVSALAKDISEILAQQDGSALSAPEGAKIAFHSPCTLQHGLRITGVAEQLLSRLGFTLTPVADAHLCCGSAGTYSLLQPALSRRLQAGKIAALEANGPDLIATANIGCLVHLQAATERPVRHWIEVVASAVGVAE